MKRIFKNRKEPKSLQEHRCAEHADYDNYAEKDDLRDSLLLEQGRICCYCMQRIYKENMRIEHWHCQANYEDEQLKYNNLLGACHGNEGEPVTEEHCDKSKGNLALSRNPAVAAHRVDDVIHYLGDGTVTSDDEAFNEQLVTVLNLNRDIFKNNRKGKLDGFILALPKIGPLHKPTLQRMIVEWGGKGGVAELPPYSGVVVYWLRKRLARI